MSEVCVFPFLYVCEGLNVHAFIVNIKNDGDAWESISRIVNFEEGIEVVRYSQKHIEFTLDIIRELISRQQLQRRSLQTADCNYMLIEIT